MEVFERYLTESEERQLLRAVREHGSVLARRDLAWMEALRCTGVRIQAFSQLTVGHALYVRDTCYLRLEAAIQKRSQAHTLRVPQRGRDAFARLLKIRREQGYSLDPAAPLVMSRNHRALSVRSYQARLSMWCDRAGLAVSATPHWFRHTLAKRVFAASTAHDPAGVVQVVLGHRSRTSTSCYLTPDRESVESVLEEAC